MSDTAIDAYRANLDPELRATVDGLRALIAGSHDGLTESIKWNAPSFAHQGEHRITLGLDRKGGVRVVVHRDAKAKDIAGFEFEDPDSLAAWPAPDRGVLVVRDAAEVDAKADALSRFFTRWIEATAAA